VHAKYSLCGLTVKNSEIVRLYKPGFNKMVLSKEIEQKMAKVERKGPIGY